MIIKPTLQLTPFTLHSLLCPVFLFSGLNTSQPIRAIQQLGSEKQLHKLKSRQKISRGFRIQKKRNSCPYRGISSGGASSPSFLKREGRGEIFKFDGGTMILSTVCFRVKIGIRFDLYDTSNMKRGAKTL